MTHLHLVPSQKWIEGKRNFKDSDLVPREIVDSLNAEFARVRVMMNDTRPRPSRWAWLAPFGFLYFVIAFWLLFGLALTWVIKNT